MNGSGFSCDMLGKTGDGGGRQFVQGVWAIAGHATTTSPEFDFSGRSTRLRAGELVAAAEGGRVLDFFWWRERCDNDNDEFVSGRYGRTDRQAGPRLFDVEHVWTAHTTRIQARNKKRPLSASMFICS